MAKTGKKSLRLALSCTVVLAAMAVSACLFRPDRAIRIGVASISQTLCGEVFVAGLDPDRVYAEEIAPRPGVGILLKRLRYTIDRRQSRVVTTWAGHFASTATYHPGYGCVLDVQEPGSFPALPAPDAAPEPVQGVPGDAGLATALDHAFAEPPQPPFRQVRAIVVVRDGKLLAERYAPGIGPDTPLLGYSVSKSVINALIGVLVREGRLDPAERAPVAAWKSTADPRHAITLDQLLRMTSGLRLEETSSGFDPVSRMLLAEHDMAAYAETAKLKATPGRRFEYSSGNTLIVSSILRQAVGGTAQDVLRFAHEQLFDPLGMRHVTIEFDGAGTPIGSTRIYASARDWARFGQLYLDGGVVAGRRILPPGWVKYATTPTLDSDYGAGFWLNSTATENAHGRVRGGMPSDAFFASGNFGQRIVVLPSQKLVIVRFGATMDPPTFDIRGLNRLVAEVIAATAPQQPKPSPAGGAPAKHG